jgi:hypothetical protein
VVTELLHKVSVAVRAVTMVAVAVGLALTGQTAVALEGSVELQRLFQAEQLQPRLWGKFPVVLSTSEVEAEAVSTWPLAVLVAVVRLQQITGEALTVRLILVGVAVLQTLRRVPHMPVLAVRVS